jgi:acyl-CoA thioester hydrolase
MNERFGRYPVSVSIPVAWGEMDSFQHVNNVVYARWVETARIAYLSRIHLLNRVHDDGIGPILARIAIDYRHPVTFPDVVRVEATTVRIGNSSFTMAHRIFSTKQEIEVATGEDVIVVLDYRTGKARPVDEKIRSAIAALEGATEAPPDAAVLG